MGEMEEELRAKALASMSVSAKPKNIHLNNTKPSPNPKEEGELSSPSEPDDDEEEEQDKPQEIPASTAATCSSGGSDRLRVQTSSVAQRNKLAQAPTTVSSNGEPGRLVFICGIVGLVVWGVSSIYDAG